MIRALYDEAPGVRTEAAYHLGNVGDATAKDHLEGKLSDRELDAYGEPVAKEARRSIFRLELMAARRRRAAR